MDVTADHGLVWLFVSQYSFSLGQPALTELGEQQIAAVIGYFWWPFFRIAAFFWSAPVFNDFSATSRIRLILSALLGIIVAPLVPSVEVEVLSINALLLALEQVLFGVLMGACLQITMSVMNLLGQFISMQMGLSMAVMNDPGSGASVPLLAQLFSFLAVFIYLSLNGHLIAFETLVASFHIWPPGSSLYALNILVVIKLFGWMFAAALLLSMPVLFSMLVVNITFGIINRSAPSMNLIAIGFPITLLMGLLCTALILSGVATHFSSMATYALEQLQQLLT
jgi:flagellar biosynthesis protein FliR